MRVVGDSDTGSKLDRRGFGKSSFAVAAVAAMQLGIPFGISLPRKRAVNAGLHDARPKIDELRNKLAGRIEAKDSLPANDSYKIKKIVIENKKGKELHSFNVESIEDVELIHWCSLLSTLIRVASIYLFYQEAKGSAFEPVRSTEYYELIKLLKNNGLVSTLTLDLNSRIIPDELVKSNNLQRSLEQANNLTQESKAKILNYSDDQILSPDGTLTIELNYDDKVFRYPNGDLVEPNMLSLLLSLCAVIHYLAGIVVAEDIASTVNSDFVDIFGIIKESMASVVIIEGDGKFQVNALHRKTPLRSLWRVLPPSDSYSDLRSSLSIRFPDINFDNLNLNRSTTLRAIENFIIGAEVIRVASELSSRKAETVDMDTTLGDLKLDEKTINTFVTRIVKTLHKTPPKRGYNINRRSRLSDVVSTLSP